MNAWRLSSKRSIREPSWGRDMANRTTPLQLTGIIVEEQTQLTLADLSRVCSVHAEYIIELVEEGVLIPEGREPRQWRFTGLELRRASIALRLQRDLGVNVAGVGLALQLLDELSELRARLSAMGSE